jgi:hypothetical protein
MRWERQVARMGDRRGAYRILEGGHVHKKPRRIRENNVYLQEVRWGGMDWVDLAESHEAAMPDKTVIVKGTRRRREVCDR